ncbi:MAG: tRNA uridine-5-carboxymethylaminomethyl(34) synthesis GTPase MnmE [Caulobacteraceae bacterium]
MTDTIFALATGSARAAIAMVRISGPGSRDVLLSLTERLPTARQAALRTLRSPENGQILDQAVVLWFPAPASFTGEDQVELHLHGGSAVIQGVTQALINLGLRPAEPGEFTRRAFEKGRLDLAEAEAIADLVDAETEAQKAQALAQLGGGLSRRQAHWRSTLVQASAMLEADIDFPDEEIPSGLEDQARALLETLVIDLEAAITDHRGEQVRDGYRVALLGAPNAGKSSLLNALVGRDAAIVTDIAGTTRDVIEVSLTVEGFRVILADTAGLREAQDRIEIEGIRRAEAWAAGASLRMLVVDQSAGGADWKTGAALMRAGDVVVLNKMDQPSASENVRVWALEQGFDTVACQADAGGIYQVSAILSSKVVTALRGVEFPAATRARHRVLLVEAAGALRRGLMTGWAERLTEDVRLASRLLAQLVGEIGSEDILDAVFGAFCIGK